MRFGLRTPLLFRTAWDRYLEFHARAPFKHTYIALIGIFAYPFYYIMWSFIFPQPFESAALRISGMALCAGVYAGPHWPEAARKWYLAYTYVALTLCLPTFFTFMCLMNGANAVWLMSMMASLLFVVLLYDIFNAVIVAIVGSLLGVGLFFLVHGFGALPIAYASSIPIFMFTVAAVIFLSYSERLIGKEKLQAAHFLASNIAHEMRTPLLGIRFDSQRVQSDVEILIAAAHWAENNGWRGKTLPGHQVNKLRAALQRIEEHTHSANSVIEMLLINARPDRVGGIEFKIYQIDDVIQSALDRYHFKPGERDLIRVTGDTGISFYGSDLLMVHVLFNLLKNALLAVETKGYGGIEISVQSGKHTALSVHDSGDGIPPEIINYIFMPFVTGSRRMQGTGIGLAFCKQVIERFGGQISCTSRPDLGTYFQIELPCVDAAAQGAPASIRNDLKIRV